MYLTSGARMSTANLAYFFSENPFVINLIARTTPACTPQPNRCPPPPSLELAAASGRPAPPRLGEMETARAPAAPATSRPRTVEAIFRDFSARRSGLVRALTSAPR
ncbi:uncharacterized protein [Triticum aestivum]|uniref:uncharacterized protein n=1 Tax=Triticum aestivum TaxID=4565 RepID=UPI001D010924|nr:uncharacterized protein LOC123165946 [Triticum aestivum]